MITPESLEDLGKKIIEGSPESKRKDYGSPLLEGFNNLNIAPENISAALNSPYFTNRYLTAVGKTEWSSLKWNDQSIAQKKTVINSANIIFVAAESAAAYQKARDTLRAMSVNDRLFDCSDAHNWPESGQKDSLGRCELWLKADPTFRGLQHALFEFDERVFVGTTPEKLLDVRRRPHQYIDSISIEKSPRSPLAERWFGSNVVFNPGLVAVIGNKGSGKSALADILALGGNSQRERNFSFLTDEKFRQPRDNKSEHFSASLAWCSSETRKYSLSSTADASDVERVRYIPQSYLETLCNELNVEGSGAFDQELRAVIFSHIPVADRIGKSSLDELLTYLSEETFDRINALKGELSKLNREVALLEEESSPEHKREIEKRLTARLKDLETLKAAEPKKVLQPEADPATQKVAETLQEKIGTLRALIKELEARVEESQQERKNLVSKVTILDKTVKRLENFEESYRALVRESASDLSGLGIDLAHVLKVDLDFEPLRATRKRLAADEAKAQSHLDDHNDRSAVARLAATKKEIAGLQSQLDAPTRRYQEYITAHKEWLDSVEKTEKDTDDANSIATLQATLRRLAELPAHIQELTAKRMAVCKDIYSRISDLKQHYKHLYRPVQDFITGHRTLAESIQLSFDVRISEGNVVDGILEWLNRAKSGSFQGAEEGAGRLRLLAKRHNFDSVEGLEAFLTELTQALHSDIRQGPVKPASPAAQLRTGRSVGDFYDYLFGLSFLTPRYALKMEGKELFELSPGERGLLLLLFYLLVEKSEGPLILDQPEENLDNETVNEVLVPSIQRAKRWRQIIIVTHNPNLAVVADADQIIVASIDKRSSYEVSYRSGALENPDVNGHVVTYLEGTLPAFMKRDQKYIR